MTACRIPTSQAPQHCHCSHLDTRAAARYGEHSRVALTGHLACRVDVQIAQQMHPSVLQSANQASDRTDSASVQTNETPSTENKALTPPAGPLARHRRHGERVGKHARAGTAAHRRDGSTGAQRAEWHKGSPLTGTNSPGGLQAREPSPVT